MVEQALADLARHPARVNQAQQPQRFEQVTYADHGHHIIPAGVKELAEAKILHDMAHEVQGEPIESCGDRHMTSWRAWAAEIEVLAKPIVIVAGHPFPYFRMEQLLKLQ